MSATVLISLVFLTWCVGQADWPNLWRASTSLSVGQWGAASLGLGCTYLLRAWRFHHEFKNRTPLSYGAWLRISLLHNTLVNWLPFRSGEVAFPLLLKREAGLPLSESLWALFWLRLQDAVVLLGLSALFWPGWSVGARWGLGGAILVAVMGLPWVLRRLGQWPWLAQKAWAKALLSEHRHSWVIWGLTVLNWSVKLVVQAYVLGALLQAAWPRAWMGAVGAELAVFLPLQGWAGIGTYEAAAALAMGLEGVAWSLGLQMALVLHLWVLLNATLAGAWAGLVTVRKTQYTHLT